MTHSQTVPTSPNRLTARNAMGLPPHFICRTSEAPLSCQADLRSIPKIELVRIAERADESFARRYAAASLLALMGDPRISPAEPVMVDLPGNIFEVGLDYAAVGAIAEKWARVGVQQHWIIKECPRHAVTLGPFRMAKYPVTNLEYKRFLVDTGSPALPTSWRFGVFPPHLSNHPVWTVRPEAADAYAAWLAGSTGRRFRLPAEAEWEYAAAGPEAREFPWGTTFDPLRANTLEAGPLQTTPVGIYPDGASHFGLLDMAGNVEELTADTYAAYPGGTPVADELGAEGSYRVARGGSFSRYGDLTRCRRRHGWHEGEVYAFGFRLAEDVGT